MVAPARRTALGPLWASVLITWILPASCSKVTVGSVRLHFVHGKSSEGKLNSPARNFEDLPPEHQLSPSQGIHLGLLNITESDHAESRRFLDMTNPRKDLTDIPVFDAFALWYWTVALVLLAIFVGIVLYLNSKTKQKSAGGPADSSSEVKLTIDLPRNMYAFTLVSALRQASTHGYEIPAPIAWVSVISMGFLQLFVLFLIVHDIDPQAVPVTSEAPHSPWIESFYTVHCMKWIMVSILICHMVGEISQITCVWEASLKVNTRRLAEPRWFIVIALAIRYIVTLGIIWGGVSAVLSLDHVPNIVYSSLAITFIGAMDESFFEFWAQILDVEANFSVTLVGSYGVPSTTEGPIKDDLELPIWYPLTIKIFQIYPMLLGFGLMGRAWYSNTMPTLRARSMLYRFLEA